MSRSSSSPTSLNRNSAGNRTLIKRGPGYGQRPPRKPRRTPPIGEPPRRPPANVLRVRVPQFVRLTDGLANALPETRQCVGQRPDMLLATRDVDGVLRQLGSLGR